MNRKLLLNKRLMVILLALCALMCNRTGAQAQMLGYTEPGQTARAEAVLYFRYLDSAWLGQEQRSIQVKKTESIERALVQALLDGPQDRTAFPQPLFAEGTSIINVLAERDRLFVSLSKEVMDPLPGENTGAGRQEAVLRRTLAMAALVNTLSESGNFRSVQVLVLDEPGITKSMRLSQRYYLDDSDALPPPLTRQEQAIITPGRAASTILERWKAQDWSCFLEMVTPGISSGSHHEPLKSSMLPLLIEWEVSSGSISPDGRSAVAVLNLCVQSASGQQQDVTTFPLILLNEGHGWRIRQQSIEQILDLAK
jgi:hypothetical protein